MPRSGAEQTHGTSLAARTIMGLTAGIVIGLFFGEMAASIGFVGSIYVNLLTMTVLPYIIVSLIGTLGQLTLEQAKLLVQRAGIILLLLWGIGLIMVVTVPLAFPALETASFFSTGFLATPAEIDLVGLFVPENVFNALVDDTVPAVVLFCIALGVALIGVKEKGQALGLFATLSEALTRVTKGLTKMAPIGIFAIAASAAGTMTLAELGRLQGYFIAYIIAFALLTFLVLPGLVAAVTPFKYLEILRASRTALLIAFATGKALVVLPMIIESVKELFEAHDVMSDEAIATAEIVVPLAYPFPSLGRMLAMLFVPFAAWFVGNPMGIADYGLYIGAGFPSFFGSVTIAVPFALELMQLPADMFQLFLVTGVIAANIADCLTAMHIMAFTVLVTCAMAGTLRIDWKAVAFVIGGTAVLGAGLLGGTRVYLTNVFEGSYNKDEVVANMQLLSDPATATIVAPGPNPMALAAGQSPLERIHERSVIRIGFIPDALPWAYSNRQEDLVGYDIDIAHQLAHDLDVTIEFVPFDLDGLTAAMADDHFDIAMSGIAGSIDRSQAMPLSSYLDINIAMVVPDHRGDEFASLESIRTLDAVKIGIASEEFVSYTATTLFPNAEFVVVPSPQDFFEQTGAGANVDAWITSAQQGAAWTLLYPAFGVVMPFPRNLAFPLVYPTLPGGDGAMKRFIDHWIGLKQRLGVFDAAYEYWILGQGSEEARPRWSVIRDVFGWID